MPRPAGSRGLTHSESVRELHLSISLLLDSETHAISCNDHLTQVLSRRDDLLVTALSVIFPQSPSRTGPFSSLTPPAGNDSH